MGDPETAVIVGRFQPFHKGHLKLLSYCRTNYTETIIILGADRNGRTERNPLLVDERKKMIEAVDKDILIRSVVEDFENPDLFAENVRDELQAVDNRGEFVLVTENETTIESLSGVFTRVDTPPIPDVPGQPYRGTCIRNRIVSGEAWTHLVPADVVESLERSDFEKHVQST